MGCSEPYGKLGTPSHALTRPGISGPILSEPLQDLLGKLPSNHLSRLCLQSQSKGVRVLIWVGLRETPQQRLHLCRIHQSPSGTYLGTPSNCSASSAERQAAAKPPSSCTRRRNARCSGLSTPWAVLTSRATN